MNKSIKITLTGVESSGKTTLAKLLAREFKAEWVPEYAREYLERHKGTYEFEDLAFIAREQDRIQEEAIQTAETLIFCDTGLLVLKIWSEYKYNQCDPWILDQLAKDSTDLYLLCEPDIPWAPDPLRENPIDREKVHHIYLSELESMDKPFFIISGPESKRFDLAVRQVKDFVGISS